MERTFTGCLKSNSRFLKKVVGNGTTTRVTDLIELNFEIFSETTGVVVTQSLGITEGFEQRVGLQNYMLHIIDTSTVTRHSRNVLHDQLGGFSFSGTGFTTDNNTLVLLLSLHGTVGFFSQ